jgi:hypothetical protein
MDFDNKLGIANHPEHSVQVTTGRTMLRYSLYIGQKIRLNVVNTGCHKPTLTGDGVF